MIPRDVAHTILCLCEEANTARAVSIAICIRYEQWDTLIGFRCSPSDYQSSGAYFRDNLVTEILRKCKGLKTSVDLTAEAIKSFWASEQDCYRTNERLTPYLYGACPDGVSRRVEEVISLARKYVSYILGPCPDLPDGRFGPGSTFADRGKLSTVPDKMSSSPTLTLGSTGVIPVWARTFWGRAVSESKGVLEEVRGNRFTTVPKDSSKDRGICIEPSINIFYQLGYGSVIRNRLKAVGIDLNNGQDIHRLRAREASCEGHLATIDLSSASDTVSVALVKLLLPDRWFEALNSLRSPFSCVAGKWVRLEKFSSMGNGYTFELETLIFLSLSFAVLALRGSLPQEGKDLLVFGDDIIVPSEAAADVVGCLRFFGFTPNGRKTFMAGPFRESCGGDFFDGRPVRAFYLEEFPCEPHQWIAYANGIRRVVVDHLHLSGEGDITFRTWFAVLGQLPSSIRSLRGPRALGDIVIHDHESRHRPESRESTGKRQRSLGSYDPRIGDGIRYFRTWSPINHRYIGWEHFRPTVVLATALYGTGDGTRGVSPRDNVLGFGERWVSLS